MNLSLLELLFVNQVKKSTIIEEQKRKRNLIYSFLILGLLNYVWQLDTCIFPKKKKKRIKVFPGVNYKEIKMVSVQITSQLSFF